MYFQKSGITIFFGLLLILLPIERTRAAEFGIFGEYSIYTADKQGFKDKILLLFHGLGSAHPNNTFRRMEKAFSGNYSVVGFNYDYMDVDKNILEFQDLWDRYLKGQEVIVLGTSLGGFWADYFANKYDIPKMVLVNPVTDPRSDLSQFIGTRYSERRQKYFDVTVSHIDAYDRIIKSTSTITRSLIILTEDDPVIDYRRALRKYGANINSEVIVHRKGGHSLPLSDPLYLSVLKVFFDTNY